MPSPAQPSKPKHQLLRTPISTRSNKNLPVAMNPSDKSTNPPPQTDDGSNADESSNSLVDRIPDALSAKFEAMAKAIEDLKAEAQREKLRRIEVEQAMADLINRPDPQHAFSNTPSTNLSSSSGSEILITTSPSISNISSMTSSAVSTQASTIPTPSLFPTIVSSSIIDLAAATPTTTASTSQVGPFSLPSAPQPSAPLSLPTWTPLAPFMPVTVTSTMHPGVNETSAVPPIFSSSSQTPYPPPMLPRAPYTATTTQSSAIQQQSVVNRSQSTLPYPSIATDILPLGLRFDQPGSALSSLQSSENCPHLHNEPTQFVHPQSTTSTHNHYGQVPLMPDVNRYPTVQQPRNDFSSTSSYGWGRPRPKLWDLPSFSGRPEDWPKFLATFRMSTNSWGYNDLENCMRLQKSLSGPALESVESLLIHPENIEHIMSTLEMRFGCPEDLVRSQLTKVQSLPKIGMNHFEQIVPFSTVVKNVCAFLDTPQTSQHLSNPMLISELVGKLPVMQQMEWVRLASTIKPYPTLRHLSEWLTSVASTIGRCPYAVNLTNNIMPSTSNASGSNNRPQNRSRPDNHRNQKPNMMLHASDVTPTCSVCLQSGHQVEKCALFQKKAMPSRWEIVKENRLCFSCLRKGHSLEMCRNRKRCGIDDCRRVHHYLLHEDSKYTSRNNSNPFSKPSTYDPSKDDQADSRPQTSAAKQNPSTATILNCQPPENDPPFLFKIVPVKLFGPNRELDTFALIDGGSSVTVIDEDIAAELNLQGPSEVLNLQWFGSQKSAEISSIVNLEIQGVGRRRKRFELCNVRTVRNIDLPMQTIRYSELNFESLQVHNLPKVDYANAKPKILIGVDNGHLGVVRQTFETTQDAPIVENTRLGWIIYGPNKSSRQQPLLQVLHVKENHSSPDNLDVIHAMVKDYFTLENFGVQPTERLLEPDQHVRARQILERTTKRVGDRFQSGLLWKTDRIDLPSSRQMAVNRLASIERKMRRDPEYAARYIANINDYVSKGYARKLSAKEAAIEPINSWYLPHFSVQNANKPEKFRLVFDAAAVVDGISLNSALMSGPDYNRPLSEILFRFRLGIIGVCADIKEMYHQIQTQPADRPAQRFLWRDGNAAEPISTYEMTVMTFGATCSPCIAQYVKEKNALEHVNTDPAAVKAIVEQHYVDDYVISFSSETEAIDVSRAVTRIHAKGGFELLKFVSNSTTVRAALGGADDSSLNMHLDPDAGDKILGMFWNTNDDTFSFHLKFHRVHADVISLKRKPTKREALSFLMSVYDPYGLLADFMIYAKLQLQELWTIGLGWDEPVPQNWYERWTQWLKEIEVVKTCRVPRCYSPHILSCRDLQLHIFADASESAFAAVAYWRVDAPNRPQIAFVAGKTKCAPQKVLSIPRLELQAAVLAVRLKKTIAACHALPISRTVFWTDSKTVVQWIKSDHRQYKPFVAHRVSEILDESDTTNWRWLPTKVNVADDATRARCPPKYDPESRWLRGPDFLFQDELEWPTSPDDITVAESRDELRPRFLLAVSKGKDDFHLIAYNRFSQYLRLSRTLAWSMRFTNNMIATVQATRTKRRGELSVEEIREAETVLFRTVQSEGFASEIADLTSKVAVNRQSDLYQLQPYLDDQKVMRVAGRLDAAPHLSEDAKRPVLFPKEHPVTALIVMHYHQKMKHQLQETVICAIREKFWIPHLRSLVKRAKSQCTLCKVRSSKPNVPVMGPLPIDRLTPNLRPFTNTGLDFFGPVFVTVGRNREKRWVALFTCMAIRAVHLEIAADLSTDACIVCIRNFCNLRGVPARIRSDNGTNFVGTNREFRNCVDLFDQNTIKAKLSAINIEWIFNCPANPEAGGAWERLVQSTKKVLAITLKEFAPRVETLRSLLLEAANIINSRPLTHLPVTPDEPEPLTPNHFLLGSISSTQLPGDFDKRQLCLRKQWRIAQQLKNHFWHRWTLEYLPDLTRRTKWNAIVKPLAEGDLVFICDESLPRNQWSRGKVIAVAQGTDGRIRSATIQTATGTLRRPASRLAILDVSESPTLLDSRGEDCGKFH